jgi:3'-phosphoadenosine 5'-phosphosulfate sulfotransferase (PAPS reductase)/FAD synthetase
MNDLWTSAGEKIEEAGTIIDRAITEYQPSHILVMLSGGNDSAAVSHFASGHLRDRPFHIAHINTSIGIPAARAHVYNLCILYDWALKEYRAVHNGQRYEDIVLNFGFPGPAQHRIMFSKLKERALRQLMREHDGAVMLISGARKQESAARMRLPDLPVHRNGRTIWCSPFFYLSNEQLSGYIEQNKIPESPVRKFLCISGECLCGCFAQLKELLEIELWFPETGQRLRELQERVRAAGFPWSWGQGPPEWWVAMKDAQKAGQADAFVEELAEEIQMLCTSCQFRHEKAEKA